MNKNTLLAFLGGVVAGGFTALLLAPKNGEETRKFISDKVKEGVKSGLGEAQYEELRSKINDLKSDLKNSMTGKDTPGAETV
ncbi:MAG: YtxH domain-containing protein [Prevotellaceae bacterium]|jgi:gas vesicle protein|nr:YtxH domain-containing protein [Prevotellaceae bacterium]